MQICYYFFYKIKSNIKTLYIKYLKESIKKVLRFKKILSLHNQIKKRISMTLIDFIKEFPDEESCKSNFNAKRQLLNTHHDIKPEFLQKYLDEFCYKFNQRYAGEALFNRLLVACVSYKNDFRYKYG